MTSSTGNAPGGIFMSYRHDDTDYHAAWLYQLLAGHFSRKQIFKDINSIELGDDFVEVITTAVESCDVLLALIGGRWLTITDQKGRRRLDDPDDFVRLEIEAALARNVRVIPILVEGAQMPRSDELPASLAKLARRQALELSPSRLDLDTQRLLSVLDRTIAELPLGLASAVTGDGDGRTATIRGHIPVPDRLSMQSVDEREVSFIARDLVVKVAHGKVLLDHVSFPVPEPCLVGVIGPSGSGKSILLGALTGMRPADTGTVLFDNLDLYQHYAELRDRVGLVPHGNALHTQLTVRHILRYAAELRFPADASRGELDHRVDEVLSELGLSRHANVRLGRLSGGQLKRVDIAQELLTKPSLLFVDEPASGLDPGLDTRMMEWMRDLALDGQTVIVVTHNVGNLDKCDRLLVIIPGGKVAFYGPPAEGLSYFGKPGWAEVFQAFERYPDRDWAAEFAASPAHARYVTVPRPRPAEGPGQRRQPPEAPPSRRRGTMGQLATLTRRYVRLIAANRGYLTFIGLMPVILGVVIRLFPSRLGLAGAPGTNQDAQALLLTLVSCACLSGAASSVRELVGERRIYARERAAGLSCSAYVFSKLLVLGVISIVQSVVLVLLGVAGRPIPPSGAFLAGGPFVELLLAVAAIAVASMCLGLLVSCLVSTPEKAVISLVPLTLAQIVLSGGALSLTGKVGLAQLAWMAPARWGFGAVAATANLNAITPSPLRGGFTDPLWRHTSSNWLRDMGFTIGLAVIFALLVWIRLRRLSPGALQ